MRKHRTQEQWQVLVDQQRDNGLSAPQFCKQEKLGYASFCNWRNRLSKASSGDASSSDESGFLDLSSLMGGSPDSGSG
jgi:putative transposase